MPRKTKKPLRSRAASALEACIRPSSSGLNIGTRAVVMVFAIVIIVSVTGRGQDRDSRGAAANPGQPPAQTRHSPGIPMSNFEGKHDEASVRNEIVERLKELGATPDSGPPSSAVAAGSEFTRTGSRSVGVVAEDPARSAGLLAVSSDHLTQKPLQKLLQTRLQLLDEHSRLTMALKKATGLGLAPEHQTEQFKAELSQIQTMLKQAENSPETLLPDSFHKTAGVSHTVVASEIKDAIEATARDLDDWKSRMETLRSGRTDRESSKKARAAERDKSFKLVTSLSATSREYEKAVTDAQSVGERQLAQERLVNYDWEVRVESLRLRVIESQIALEAKLTALWELEAQVCHAHIQLAERSLAQMRTHFRANPTNRKTT